MGLIVFLLATFVLSSCGTYRAIHNPVTSEENQLKVRVAIVSHGRNVKIQSAGGFRICGMDGKTPAVEDKPYSVSTLSVINASADGIMIGKLGVPLKECRIVPQEGASIIVYELKEGERDPQYYGELYVYRNDKDNTVDVVNEVGLEDYLAGVLGREVVSDWPVEALKTQAVASRTRVLYQRQMAHANKQRFDVQADTRDQVYGGVPDKNAQGLYSAVKGTAGQVLTFNGNIFDIYFASTCGGETEDVSRVFKTAHPPGGFECPYCKDSPVGEWTHAAPLSDVKVRIQQHCKEPIGDIISITGLDTVPPNSGHAGSVEVKHTLGVTVFPDANKFRTTVLGRSSNIKFLKDGSWHDQSEDRKHDEYLLSTWFTAAIEGNTVTFHGFGWGHAVGMCQWGAFGMAKAGKKYTEILAFYYPGTQIAEKYHMRILNGGGTP
jgi:stage II sporulation protein D